MNKRTCFQLIRRRATDSRSGAAETRTGAAEGDPGQGEETVRGAEEEVSNGSADGKVERRLVRVRKKWIVELGDGDSYGAVMQSLPPFCGSGCRGEEYSCCFNPLLHTRG
jgi:hypothetical protein